MMTTTPHMHQSSCQQQTTVSMEDKTPEKMVCGIILNNWKSRHNTKLLMRKALQHTDTSIFKADVSIQKKRKTENKGKFKFHQYQAPTSSTLQDTLGFCMQSSSLVENYHHVNVKKSKLSPSTNNNYYNYEKSVTNNQTSPYIEKQVVFKFATHPHQTANSAKTNNTATTTTTTTNMYRNTCGTSSTSSTNSSSNSRSMEIKSNQLMDDDYNNHYQYSTPRRWSSFELPQINCHQATISNEQLPSFSQLINTLGI